MLNDLKPSNASATPADYTLQITAPAGFAFDSNGNWTSNLTFAASENYGQQTVAALQSSPPAAVTNQAQTINGLVTDDDTNAGLANVTVALSDAAGVAATTTTGADGTYSFGGLIVSPDDNGFYHDYTIALTAPAGYVFDNGGETNYSVNSLDVSTDSGQQVNASAYQPTVYGNVSDENSGNGGLAGVTLTLTDSSGANFTTTTDPNGGFQFRGMALGSYTVVATAPAGYAFDGGNMAGGWVGNGYWSYETDFRAYQLANLTVTIADDSGGGLAGANLTLVGPPTPLTETTDGNGTHTFADLSPDEYFLNATPPAGMVFDRTGFDDWNGYWNGGDNYIQLQPGEDLNVTWSAYAPTTLAGTATTVLGYGNVPLAGVSVALLGSDGQPVWQGLGSVLPPVTTTANGTYSFSDLAPGNYTEEFVAPAGYLLTDANGDGVPELSQPLTIQSGDGTDTANVTAMPAEPQSVSGTVWMLTPGNGTWVPGIAGLGNVSVTLEVTDNDGITRDLESDVTDGNGNYSFGDLLAGTYSLKFAAPMGYFFDDTGNATTTAPAITPGPGATVDEAVYQAATVTGTVWEDADGDGLMDGSETGLGGATMQLLDPTTGLAALDVFGNAIAAVTTDATGNYSIANVTPGCYTVQFTAPSGYVLEDSGNSTWQWSIFASDLTLNKGKCPL